MGNCRTRIKQGEGDKEKEKREGKYDVRDRWRKNRKSERGKNGKWKGNWDKTG